MFQALLAVLSFSDTTIYRHGWDTVADVMGMHGKFKGSGADYKYPDDAAVEFVTKNYGMVTTGTGCPTNSSVSIEDAVLSVAARAKEINPKVKMGMYFRTDIDIELSVCTNFSSEFTSDWLLRDDKGVLVKNGHNFMFDYLNKDFRAFFTKVLVNVVSQTSASGEPRLDYIYLDGPDWRCPPGISAVRSAMLLAEKMAFLSDLQAAFDAIPGGGRNIILNAVDTSETAQRFNPTGAAGCMLDHWTILQFLNRTDGTFNQPAQDGLFNLARSELLSNMSLFIKGWVGPVIKQQGQYPPNIPTPKTPEEKAVVAGERFNSELAFFLLVAEDHMYWFYSWFWGFDDWVPGLPDSTFPKEFFPQTKCALGAPAGPPTKSSAPGTWIYTREYEHASVYVDLDNRTASKVIFKGSC
jgi:hypothetical protein